MRNTPLDFIIIYLYYNNNKCNIVFFVFKITFFHMSTSCYIIRSQGLGGAPHYSRHFSCMERTSQGDFLGVNERVCSNLPHGLKVS